MAPLKECDFWFGSVGAFYFPFHRGAAKAQSFAKLLCVTLHLCVAAVKCILDRPFHGLREVGNVIWKSRSSTRVSLKLI
jgi:hypothetical protein